MRQIKKTFNPKYEVILISELEPIGEAKGLTVEDVVPHSQSVTSVYYNMPLNADGDFRKINLGRDFILELADQIRQIEGEVVDAKFTYNFPW